jgi:prevent-host-death family protein
MNVVNIHEAKTQLSRYLQEVAAGGEVVIGRYGEPIAKLVPYVEKPKYRFGLMAGKIKIPDDFDAYDQEIVDMFEGKYEISA